MPPNSDRHIGAILDDQNGDQKGMSSKTDWEQEVWELCTRGWIDGIRLVAIKVVESTISPDHVAEFAKEGGRFQQEVLTLQGLEHPHIVPLWEVGLTGNQDYFIWLWI